MNNLDEIKARRRNVLYGGTPEIDADIDALLTEVERLTAENAAQKMVSVSVENNPEMVAFGGYLVESAKTGEAIVRLNLGLNLALAKKTGERFTDTVAQTLAHELHHVCQEIAGVIFNETEAESFMEQVDTNCLGESEDAEQAMQEVMTELNAVKAENARLRAELERVADKNDLAICSVCGHYVNIDELGDNGDSPCDECYESFKLQCPLCEYRSNEAENCPTHDVKLIMRSKYAEDGK